MTTIRLAAVALNQTPLAWEENAQNIVRGIRDARAAGAAIICLPELCITGYGCEDTFFSEHVYQTAVEILDSLLPETQGCIVALGLPLRHRGDLYNAACLAVDGQIAGFVGKQHLAGDGIHYEPRWFRHWPAGVHEEVTIGGDRYPSED